MEELNENKFETKIKPILKYVGTIGATLMAIAYVAIVLIMVFGFEMQASITQSIVFAIVNAVMGLIIMQFLKVQGIDLARELPANAEILKKYFATKTKDKKNHSLKYFWITTFTKDFIIRAATIAATTLCIIYIIIRGTGDLSLLLLAVVNLIMFFCFGLLSLVKAYDFFNDEYIPYIQEKIDEADEEKRKEEEEQAHEKERLIEAEIKRRLDIFKKELIEQANDCLYNSRRDNLLESSVDNCNTSDNSEPMVLVSNDSNNCVLGGPIHSSDITSDRVDNMAERHSQENIKTEET